MTAMFWQSALMMGLAYFAGCCLACMLRRKTSSTSVRAQEAQLMPAAAAAAAAAARPMAPAPVAPVAVVRAPAAAPAASATRDAFRRADTLEPKAPVSPGVAAPAVSQFERTFSARPNQPEPIGGPIAAPATSGPQVAAPPTIVMPAARPVAAPAAPPIAIARPVAPVPAARAPVAPVAVAPVSIAPAAVIPAEAQSQAATAAKAAALAATAAVASAAAAAVRSTPSAAPQAQSPAHTTVRVPATSAPMPPPVGAPQIAVPAVAVPAVASPPVAVRPAAAPAVATAAAVSVIPDDLKRIRAIDAVTETSLNRLGVRRYSEIAAWKTDDVARISRELGFDARIEQENWIEQAQILGRGEDTFFSRRLARGEMPSARPIADEGERSVAAPVAPAAPIPARSRSGVEAAAAAAAAMAAAAGRTHAAAISPPAPGAAPTAAMAQAPAPASAPMPAHAAPSPTPASPAQAPSPALVSDRAAFATQAAPPVSSMAAAAAMAAAVAAAAKPAIGAARDNLQRIGGINAEVEKLLNVQGVNRYVQIAHWGKPETERFDRLLGFQGRIQRENWIEQAQILAKGGDTAYSREFDRRTAESLAKSGDQAAARPTRLADAIRSNDQGTAEARPRSNDLSSLRSVRSEAFRQPDTSHARADAAAGHGGARSVRSAVPDDLKRIRGIGVLIEKKLNSMGVTGYEQIASWQANDIERVSQVLDFKGRIERENWVEQARILAAGGQTEFSRRADRGDVDPGR